MKTKITIVCENSVHTPLPLIAEHGLSMLVEQGDAALYDTGQGLGIINNLRHLGKNIDSIERVILSHGHYDHTGGLLQLLHNRSREAKLPVFAHGDAFIDRRAIVDVPGNTIEAPIGMRAPRSDYEQAGADFRIIQGFTKITNSITGLSDVKRPSGWKSWDVRLKQKVGDVISDDPFNDDLSLLVETDAGPVVLLGCAHAGIVEILDDLSGRSGHREFHAVIGGTHLASASEEYVERAIDALKGYRVRVVAVSHCTGFARACRFAAEFKERFARASAGAVFEF
jgi:7,8-dihydropterin-6-yl-methyl-4-(beta-D-ribofuranosyl)aminobenzene 5'-phosphate synthase